MVYKFVIISDEVDDFFREIQIDSEEIGRASCRERV